MNEPDQEPIFRTISDVECEVGIAKETLRVWERRYGFPQPGRDHHNERTYPLRQVERLIRIKSLIDRGHRPGKLMELSDPELAALGLHAGSTSDDGAVHPDVESCLMLLRTHQADGLRTRLAQALLRRGLRTFIVDLVAPLTAAVAGGAFAVFEEHLYAETVQRIMRGAVDAAARPEHRDAAAPRILLTSVPQDRRALDLMLAEALFSLEGAECISLGPQTPLADIVSAAQAYRSDVVALSFSRRIAPRAVADSVTELRYRFGQSVQVWASGPGALAAQRAIGADTVVALDQIATAIARWKRSFPPGLAA